EMVVVSLRVTWQSWYLRGSLFFPRPVASALVKVHSASGSMTGSLPGSCASREHPVRFYWKLVGHKSADNLLSAGSTDGYRLRFLRRLSAYPVAHLPLFLSPAGSHPDALLF